MAYIDFIKKLRPVFSKWVVPIGIDIVTIASNVAGGISNTVASSLGFGGFLLMQAKDYLDNSITRHKIEVIHRQISRTITELEEKKIANLPSLPLDPTGCAGIGLHENKCSTAVSRLLALVNSLLAATATGLTIKLNVTSETKDQTYCVSGYCISAYVIAACSIILSTVERYLKTHNLEKWNQTHKAVLKRLKDLQNENNEAKSKEDIKFSPPDSPNLIAIREKAKGIPSHEPMAISSAQEAALSNRQKTPS